MPIVIEDADMPAIRRFLAHLFGIPLRDDAAAHAATQELIRNLTTITETKMTQAADDIAQLQGDVSALSGAFTAFQAKVQTDAQAAAQKAADLQTQLDAAKAALDAAVKADPEAVPADVQTALDAAHAASQALVTQINALSTAAAAPTADQGTPAPTPEPAPAPADPNAPAGGELPSQPTA